MIDSVGEKEVMSCTAHEEGGEREGETLQELHTGNKRELRGNRGVREETR